MRAWISVSFNSSDSTHDLCQSLISAKALSLLRDEERVLESEAGNGDVSSELGGVVPVGIADLLMMP
ncbi:MAG TPA: hypothetical protein VIG78_09200 [Gemmatimonadaceae bacterium]